MTVDLSLLPRPRLLDVLTFDQVVQDLRDDLRARAPDLDGAFLASDPVTKILDVLAYREVLLRQHVADRGASVLLAYAAGPDLDALAALVGVFRQVVDPGDPIAIPPRPRVMEADERLRGRAQGAWAALSVAGPTAAYTHHARAADPRVADVAVTSPAPGEVVVYILDAGAAVAPDDLVDRVHAALDDQWVRPLTDRVTVQAGQPVLYQVHARLTLYPGPDASVVRQAAMDSLTAALARHRRLGERVGADLLYAALRVEGVRVVDLLAPTAAVECGLGQYPSCTSALVEVA